MLSVRPFEIEVSAAAVMAEELTAAAFFAVEDLLNVAAVAVAVDKPTAASVAVEDLLNSTAVGAAEEPTAALACRAALLPLAPLIFAVAAPARAFFEVLFPLYGLA